MAWKITSGSNPNVYAEKVGDKITISPGLQIILNRLPRDGHILMVHLPGAAAKVELIGTEEWHTFHGVREYLTHFDTASPEIDGNGPDYYPEDVKAELLEVYPDGIISVYNEDANIEPEPKDEDGPMNLSGNNF